MFNDLDAFALKRIYIACGYTDLRYGIDGLANVVQSKFEMDPFEKGILYLFCGRKKDRIKTLLWEGDGFLLLYKRIENGRFQWPRNEDELKEMTPQQFRWLMEGLSSTNAAGKNRKCREYNQLVNRSDFINETPKIWTFKRKD